MGILFLLLFTGCFNKEQSRKPTGWQVLSSLTDLDQSWEKTATIAIGNSGKTGACTAREEAVVVVTMLKAKPGPFSAPQEGPFEIGFKLDLTEGGYMTCECTRVSELDDGKLHCDHMFITSSNYDADVIAPVCKSGHEPTHRLSEKTLTIACKPSSE